MDLNDVMSDDEIREALDLYMPIILSSLYLHGELTEQDDEGTIKKKLGENRGKLPDDIWITSTISDQFYNAIIDEIEKGRINVATCLSGVYIEQITNEFYHMLLQSDQGLSNTNFADCMKSLTMKGKLTWFFTLITSKSLDSDLVAKVMKIYSTRHSVIHYKPKATWVGEKIDPDMKDDLNPKELIEVISNLDNTFNDIIDNMFPEIEIGQKLYKKLKGKAD